MTKPLIILVTILTTQLSLAQSIPNELFFGFNKSQDTKAQMLLPDIISDVAWESNGNFSPDGKIFLYSTHFMYSGSTIIYMTLKDGAWSDPEIVPFSGQFPDIDPIFSPDGKRVYFTSRRPLSTAHPDKRDANLWYVEVNDSSFGTPEQVSLAINTDENQFYNSISNNKNIFFHSRNSTSNDIYRADFIANDYNVSALDSIINSTYSEADPYISENEDYLLFASNRPGGFGGNDLYISFFENGKWTAPINLGKNINSSDNDFAPCVSSGILTFTSNRMLNSWEDYEKKEFKSLLNKFGSADNQTDNIWYVKFKAENYKNP